MSARRIAVRDMWIDGTLSEIQRALEGSPDEEERRQRIDALATSIHSKPASAEQAIRTAVEMAVEESMITEDEAQRLVPKQALGETR